MIRLEITPGSFVRKKQALISPAKEMLRAFQEAVKLADELGISGVEFVWPQGGATCQQITNSLVEGVRVLTVHSPPWVNYSQTLVEMWYHHWKICLDPLIILLAPVVSGFYTEDCERVTGELGAYLIFHPITVRNLRKQNRLTPAAHRRITYLIEPDYDRLQKGQNFFTNEPEEVAMLAKETSCEIIFDTSHNGLSKDRLMEDWEFYRKHFTVPAIHFSGWKKPVWQYPKPWQPPPGGLPVSEDLGVSLGKLREFVQELQRDCQTNNITRVLTVELSFATCSPKTAEDGFRRTFDFLTECGLTF